MNDNMNMDSTVLAQQWIQQLLDRKYIIFFPTDGLVKKLEELEKVADMYKGLIDHTKLLLKTTFELSQSHKGNFIYFCAFS